MLETKMADDDVPLSILYGEKGKSDETCVTIVLKGEDHTVGNALKHICNQYSEVEFCGYNVTHPLEEKIVVRIQTRPGHSAIDIFRKALKDLDLIFEDIKKKVQIADDSFEMPKT